MSLDWNVEEIVTREGEDFVWPTTPNREQRLNGMIECVIWATIFVGINPITTANAEEFAMRLRQWEDATGCISTRDTPITADEIRRCIGLRTNASSMTKAQFRKRLAEAIERKATDALRREARTQKED